MCKEFPSWLGEFTDYVVDFTWSSFSSDKLITNQRSPEVVILVNGYVHLTW